MDKQQVRRLIERVLTRLGSRDKRICTPAAIELLMGTMAQESRFGRYLYQLGGGPGLGFFQMEPATEEDIWENYLWYHRDLVEDVMEASGIPVPTPWALETNVAYQVTMARIHYLRVKEPLPPAGDINAQALYWKRHYNTEKGKGRPFEYVENYRRYCL